jgi:hypothetical protein
VTQNARRGCQLGPHQLRRLDLACIPIHEAWGTPYLVGSAMTHPDFRDIDVRLLLDDDEFDRLFPGGADDYGTRPSDHALNYLNATISLMLTQTSGLHHIGKEVDFQFQRRTEANARWDDDFAEHPRNPLGNRWLP